MNVFGNLARSGLLVAVVAVLCALPAAALAQSREAAQLQLQIQQLQEQIRLLTGQVEGLQFQMTQMQSLIERMSQDNEFRFQQLEGGAPPSQQQGALTPERLPEEPAVTSTLPDPAPLDLGGGDAGGLDPLRASDDEFDLGESSDPLVGSNSGSTGTLGTLGGEDLTLGGSRPLNLTLDGGAAISSGDANAQYQAGYEAIVRGDYAFAEDQFQQFIVLYPDDPNAPDATNWLGEALMQRGAYDDAALVLAEGYQKYTESARAPDLMLKLGIALVGAGEIDVACRTFFTLERRYQDLSAAFRQRLDEERARAQCTV